MKYSGPYCDFDFLKIVMYCDRNNNEKEELFLLLLLNVNDENGQRCNFRRR